MELRPSTIALTRFDVVTEVFRLFGMGDKMRKYIFCLMAAATLFCACVPPSVASVTRDQIIGRVRDGVDHVLLDAATSGQAANGAPKIASRIASSIDSLKETALDDDIADWLVDSYVTLVRNRASEVIANDATSERLVDGLVKQGSILCSTLDNNRGHDLLALRKQILSGFAAYSVSLNSFLANQFDKPANLSVCMTVEAVDPDAPSGFMRILHAALPDAKLRPGDTVDLRADPLTSQLLATAFAQTLLVTLKSDDQSGEFIANLILAPCYDYGDPFHAADWKTFEEVSPAISALFAKAVAQRGDALVIDLDQISFIHHSAFSARMPDSLHQVAPVHPNQGTITVTFRNDHAAWQLFTDPKSGMSQQGTPR